MSILHEYDINCSILIKSFMPDSPLNHCILEFQDQKNKTIILQTILTVKTIKQLQLYSLQNKNK